MSSSYKKLIIDHYSSCWSAGFEERKWPLGPTGELPQSFCVLEYAHRNQRDMWTYATCCMSEPTDLLKLELHIFAPEQDELCVELLTIVAHYHRMEATLDLGHTINFGRPWATGSRCSYGLVSLPYLDGPKLEWLQIADTDSARFLWLIPVTSEEVGFKKTYGLEALEAQFEQTGFNYLDPLRPSVIS